MVVAPAGSLLQGSARTLKGVRAGDNCSGYGPPQVMFLQRRGQVIMTIELLDTEEAQAEDPVEVQVRLLPLSGVSV